jgi:hypothetical protein
MSLEEKVRDIIVDKLGVAPEKVKGEAHFIDDLGADSLDTVELVMAFNWLWLLKKNSAWKFLMKMLRKLPLLKMLLII